MANTRFGVSGGDLLRLLGANGIEISLNEAEVVVAQYDANFDGRITADEFAILTCPSTDEHLGKLAQSRAGFPTHEVLHAFGRLAEREIALQHDLAARRDKLAQRKDFNVRDCLEAVGGRYATFIDKRAIHEFLLKHSLLASIDDLDAIIRRLDHNGDECIDYAELTEALRTQRLFKTGKTPKKARILNRKRSVSTTPKHKARVKSKPRRTAKTPTRPRQRSTTPKRPSLRSRPSVTKD